MPVPEAQRTVVGHAEHDDCQVYIGRGRGGTVDFLDAVQGHIDVGDPGWLGNPYPVQDYGREQALAMFSDALFNVLEERPRWRQVLVERCRGRVLGCWCRRRDEADPRCHGDVIARVVDDVITPAKTGVDQGDGIATDGGRVVHPADAALANAGVGDQDPTCPNGTYGCPGPDAGVGELPCADCFLEGGGADGE